VKINLLLGDCVARMSAMPEGSVGSIVCDPPYGLEFMGDGVGAGWQAGGGFAKPGIGERFTAWPSFSATSKHGMANPTCAVCGGRLRGAKKCECPKPHDHWKPIGKRKNPENEGLPDHLTGGGMSAHLNTMQKWHVGWLRECFRVLVPGGRILAFGGSRVYHRMAAAFDDAGFVDVGLEAWSYGSGFPKSMSLSEVGWSGWGTQLKPAWEPFIVGTKPG
jgi:DNA modification methylase